MPPLAEIDSPKNLAAHEIRIDGFRIPYRLVRAYRKTLAIHVVAGHVEVRAPWRAAQSSIEDFLRQKSRWVLDKLAETRDSRPFSWADGELLPILGAPVRLTSAPGGGVERCGDNLMIGDSQTGRPWRGDGLMSDDERQRLRRRARVLEWLRAEALALFSERAAHYSSQLGVVPPPIRLSNARTQWGSCIRRPSHAGGTRIHLHWRLYLLPPPLVDYVVAHELAHLRELNHSARFWAEVARVYPNAPAARRELNRLGKLLPRL